MSEGDQLATCGSKAFLKEPIRNEARNRFSSRRTFRKSDVGDIAATNTGSTTAPSAHSVRRQAGSGKQLERKLRGYLNPAARFLIMRDQDSHADCKALKKTLLAKCAAAGKGDVSLVRIACRELESFYLADLEAVESAFCLAGLRKFQGTAKYRDPDRLGSPSKELHELTGGKYQKSGDQEPLDRIWIWKTHGPTVFQI
jgi:hypothetical protein